jgi:hypothetical protein
MLLKLVRETTGKEFIQLLKKRYKSMDNLERLIKDDPGNPLYRLDLDDWLYHLDKPNAKIKESETIFVKDIKIELGDLKILDYIKKEKPSSIRSLAKAMNKDYKTIHPKVHKLANNGFIEFKEGPKKNMKKPVVTYDKIEIEV